jgi:hypothetical protein
MCCALGAAHRRPTRSDPQIPHTHGGELVAAGDGHRRGIRGRRRLSGRGHGVLAHPIARGLAEQEGRVHEDVVAAVV